MRILTVIPHETLLRPEGAMGRLAGVSKILEAQQHNLSFLIPERAPQEPLSRFSPEGVYTFAQPGLGNIRIPYFLSWNSSLRNSLRKATVAQNAELVLFVFPWGITAGRKTLELPLVCLSQGVESDFSEVTVRHLGLNFWPFTQLARSILSWIEKQDLLAADLTLTMSERDSQRLQELYPLLDEKVIYLPHPKNPLPKKGDKQTLRKELSLPTDRFLVLFHGSKSHYPNREAFRFITEELAPQALQAAPEIMFVLAGTGLEQFSRENVLSLGFLDDLAKLLFAVDAACTPLKHAFGAQMKVLDYAAAALPLVSSPEAAAGYSMTHDKNILIATRTVPETLAALIELSENPGKKESLASGALAYCRKYHSPETVGTHLENTLRRLFPQV